MQLTRETLSVLDVVLLGLAAQRLWTIWLHQEIARPARERLIRLSRWSASLATCSYCVSVWAGGGVTLLWVSGRPGRIIVTAIAVGSIALIWTSLLIALDKWTARQVGSGPPQRVPGPVRQDPLAWLRRSS